MASRTALLITAAMAVVVVGALLRATTSVAVYQVGDADGWDLGVDYEDWANGKTFKVGDTLVFVYSTEEPTHYVVQVDEVSYEACTVGSDSVTVSSGTGNNSVVFGAAGPFFFICDVEDHCESGMKLAVNVQ